MHPDALRVGGTYFIVHYYDDDLLIPDITTLQYQGADAEEDGTPMWLFSEGVPDSDGATDEQTVIGIPESQLCSVLELEGLVTVLNELRGVLRGTPSVAEFLTEADVLGKYSLTIRIEEFLKSPVHHELKICIRYRDRCLFLKKHADVVALDLFMHPMRSIDENERFDRLMGERGAHPVTDYLADRGRTRVLEYRLPAEAQPIADLCGAVLATVYQVAPSDEVLISNE